MFPCQRISCVETTPYRMWYCSRHASEMKCSKGGQCLCAVCYMREIVADDNRLRSLYGYEPGTYKHSIWNCVTCPRLTQLSKYTSERGYYDTQGIFVREHRGFCEDCLNRQQSLHKVMETLRMKQVRYHLVQPSFQKLPIDVSELVYQF